MKTLSFNKYCKSKGIDIDIIRLRCNLAYYIITLQYRQFCKANGYKAEEV